MKNEATAKVQTLKFTVASDTIITLREKAFKISQIFKLDKSIISKFVGQLNEFSQPYIDSFAQNIDSIITLKLERYIQMKKSYNNTNFRQQIIANIIDFFIRSMQEIDPTLLEKSPVFLKIQQHEILYEQSIPRQKEEELSIIPLQSLFAKQLSLPDRIKLLLLLVNEQARHQIEKIFMNHPVVQLVDRKYQVFDKLKEIKLFYLVLNDALNELVVEPIIKTLDYQRAAIAYYAQPVIDRVKQSFTSCKLQLKLCKDQIVFKALQAYEFIVLSFRFKYKDVFNHFKQILKTFIKQIFNVPIYFHKSYIYCGVLIQSFAEKYILLYNFIVQEFDKYYQQFKITAKQIAEDLYSEALIVYQQKKAQVQLKYNLVEDYSVID